MATARRSLLLMLLPQLLLLRSLLAAATPSINTKAVPPRGRGPIGENVGGALPELASSGLAVAFHFNQGHNASFSVTPM
jgi:hypothetical protein